MGAQEKSPNAHNSLQRVKVYRMKADGKWDDQGTGHVAVDYLERSEDMGLFVVDEEDNETLLLHRISSDDIYSKQEGTIISWKDPEFSTELALSFQETTGCSYIWDHICNAQRSLQFSSLTNDAFDNVNNELRELPPVELSTLPLILKILVESGITDQMRVSELIMHDQDFFRKLIELFRICEDLENLDSLHLLFKIMRGIILLNNAQIFEKMFDDEAIMDVIGCLEYDPGMPHINHRKFLKEQVVFKEAIPIKSPTVLSRIHQTYRVGYLKDIILPRAFDESVVATLNSIIHSNNAIVISLLKDDSNIIKELFSGLKSPTVSKESKKTLVQFLLEFCTLSKSLQMVHQVRIYRDLASEGIFDILADVLESEDKKLVLTGADILILFLNLDPAILRTCVAQREGMLLGVLTMFRKMTSVKPVQDFSNNSSLQPFRSSLDEDGIHISSESSVCCVLKLVFVTPDMYSYTGVDIALKVKGMLTDFGDDMHCQFLEILRSLLDTYTSGSQSDTFVEIFYEKHLAQLIDVITLSSCQSHGQTDKSMPSDGESWNPSRAKPEILLNICDLLCFCVLHHPHRIKCDFLLNNVIDKILCMARRREKYLVVAAVRFLRTLVSRSDEHVMNHFVKNNIFKPIIDAFVANGDRYNLLNSAVLELFEFIRKENLKVLLKYLIDTFWDQLAKFDNLSSIKALKVKYEQSLESAGTRSPGSLVEQRKRIDERALEKEEEDYFNEDSDEEDSASAQTAGSGPQPPVLANGSSHPSPRSGGLYDDEDEDYKPPPKRTEPSNDDESTHFMLKRKLTSKNEPQPKRLQVSQKGLKPREGIFASLFSTLSHTVLPGKKSANTALNVPESDAEKKSCEHNIDEKGSDNSPIDQTENHSNKKEASRSQTESDVEEASRSFSDGLSEDWVLI